jgi:hypothetical protein
MFFFLSFFLLSNIVDSSKRTLTEDLKFCRETEFVPLLMLGRITPKDFPEEYVSAMDDMVFVFSKAFLVRNTTNSPSKLNIKIEYTEDRDAIASTQAIHRDRCGRPDLGKIFWNSKELKYTKKQFQEIFLHEVMHLMGGFGHQDGSYYYFFGKPNLQEVGLINGYIKEVDNKFYVVSPGVLDEVKKINPKLIGARLETHKKNRVVYPHSHWHAEEFTRDIGQDLMVPYSRKNAQISPVTVAMINDFGWYHVDLEMLNFLLDHYFGDKQTIES